MARLSAPNSTDMDLVSRAIVILAIAFTFLVTPTNSPAQRRADAARAQVLDSVSARADLYPADADAKKEIDEAVSRAAVEHKRVLLIFGANWCYDCHVLDHALHDGDAGKILSENFLLVRVDIGEGERNPDLLKAYKIPLDKGVPAVAILAGDGRLLYSSGDGEFEAARRMLKKDLVAFLKHWKRTKSKN
ncbi:MAG TPA: thioredoxin family protein [Pyrinomonadaceae bacterium]|nr:thioredoxin family protein [Pyrinomonadaceae bacterium]